MFVKQDLWLACHQRLDDVIAAAKAQLPKWLAPIQHPSKAILKDENRQNYCTVLYISVISLLAVMITLMKVMIARPTFLELNHVTKWVARAQQSITIKPHGNCLFRWPKPCTYSQQTSLYYIIAYITNPTIAGQITQNDSRCA